jgi:hypothetical protein
MVAERRSPGVKDTSRVDVAVGTGARVDVAVTAGVAVGGRGVGDGIKVEVGVGTGVGSISGLCTATAHNQMLAPASRAKTPVRNIQRRAV